MKRSMQTLLAAALGCVATLAQAQQPAYLAANCANCHGTDGRAVGAMPPLAGMDAARFTEQMNAFKSGKRVGTVMNQLAKGYTDEQVAVLARYFAAQSR